ncbi:MAG: hypothetical protein Ta2B_06100 [Termitinemataceae bacterium]|nr:MAG: hypothetical protein Ta2B_06100 [Termitinemataceae bacterium]
MSDISENPYQSPQHEAESVNQIVAGGTLSDNAIAHLKDASPWIRFLAIVGYIGCGFMVLVGIVMLIVGAATANLDFPDLSEFAYGTMLEGILKSFTGIIGFFYIGSAVIAFFPAKFLWTFGSKLRNFIQSNSANELELALKNNKSFWKYTGILTIVSLAIIPITFIIGIIGLIVGLGSRHL